MTDVQIAAVDEDQLDTILAADVEFVGSLSFDKPLMVKGRLSGLVRSASEFYVDEKAEVEADVKARVVSVKGAVRGDIEAGERFELAATGAVTGDVLSPKITMETGCVFNGSCRMVPPPADGN